jgi:hypothetical protein
VLSNGHAGFGGRPEETDQPKGWHRASGRPNRAQGKRHSQAVLALARRRLNVLWAIIRDETTYAPVHLKAA